MSAPESRQPSQPTRIWQLELSRSPSALSPAGRALPLQWRDAALLAWLAIEGPTPRARLAALLWPDSSTESARNSLRGGVASGALISGCFLRRAFRAWCGG